MTTLVPPCLGLEEESGAQQELGSVPAALLRPECHAQVFKSITLLAAERRLQEDLGHWQSAVRGLPHIGTQTLILRLSTSSDALLMWAIHLELDHRGVPPCLRWPGNAHTAQAEFITWLADLHWFAKRHPQHDAQHKGWRNLLAQAPATAKWHAHACRQYAYAERRRGSRSLSHWCAQGLALTDVQRQELMTLPTRSIEASRRAIQGEQWAKLKENLVSHASAHPDRSGKCNPDQVASRRAAMFRVHVLAGGAISTTSRYWTLLTGQRLSRQAIAKQLAAVEAIAGK